jgi:SAM-dependent methyltransferase
VPLWKAVFPRAELSFCDVSAVALDKLQSRYPEYRGRCGLVHAGRAELEIQSADVIVSVEVLEHVEDLAETVADVYRLLAPGGVFVWTTPCANPLSVEHLYNVFTRQIDPTPDGYRRWRWEDPTHLRRLTSAEAAAVLRRAGFASIAFRYRAHLFSFVCSRTPARRLAEPVKDRLMQLDYALFRRFPNGASMIGCARKPAS